MATFQMMLKKFHTYKWFSGHLGRCIAWSALSSVLFLVTFCSLVDNREKYLAAADLTLAENLPLIQQSETTRHNMLAALVSSVSNTTHFFLPVYEQLTLTLDLLEPPKGLQPLGMINSTSGYLLDKVNPTVLWFYDYLTAELREIIDYRGSNLTMGSEIAFNSRWLVCQELAPFQQLASGASEREVRLMARDLSAPLEASDIVLDSGSNAPAEGFWLPFDCLDLEGDSLLYRYSVFHSGNRNTQVRLINLEERTINILAASYSPQQILRCSMSDSIIAWDIETRYLHQADPLLPPLLKAKYDIYYLPLDGNKTPEASAAQQVINRGDCYASYVYGSIILAMRYHEPGFNWTDPMTGSGDGPLVEYGGMHIVNRTVDTSIDIIIPQAIDVATSSQLVRSYDYALLLLEHYRLEAAPRAIQRDHIFVGQRLLSWQSNVNEQHVVYDLVSHTFIELPVFFQGFYDDAQTIELNLGDTGVLQRKTFTYLPQLDFVDVSPIVGLDADYLYFLHFDSGDAYLLRISE